MSFWNKLTKLFKSQISFSFGRSFRINVHCCIQFCFCWIMLPFVLLFVTTIACPIFSQDSMMFIDRMLEQFSGTKRPKPSISKPKCPRELNASWLLRPPFTKTSGKNANEVGGMFHYVFDLALNKCCAKLKAGNKTRINFKTQALNRPQLHDLVLNNDHVHLILPVQSDEDKLYKMTLPFIKILDSPGVVLIQRSNLTRQSSWMMSNRGIWSVISSCLPIIALTILLSFVVVFGQIFQPVEKSFSDVWT